MQFRLATIDDLETLIDLRLAFLAEMAAPNALPDAADLAAANREYLARRLPAGECLAWLVEEAELAVATGWLVFFERPPLGKNPTGLEAYILNMYTRPEWRGRGISSRLIREMIDFAKSTPARRVWLHATAMGRPIYEQAGFVANGREMELTW